MSNDSLKLKWLWEAVPHLGLVITDPDYKGADERFNRKTRATFLLHRFIRAVDNGAIPPQEVMFFLSEAFKEIVQGDDPAHALCLNNPRGRGPGPRGPAGEQMVDEYFSRVNMAVEVVKLRLNGYCHQDALEEVGKQQLCSSSTVGRAFKKYSEAAIDIAAEHSGRSINEVKKLIRTRS